MGSIYLLGAGGGIVVGAYFLYLAATKGLPAAIAWAKAKWNAAKNDIATVRGDIVTAQVTLADARDRISKLEADVAALQAAKPAAPAPAV